MKLNRRQIAGGACILGGTVAYLWLMAAEVVPTAVDLAAAFRMSAPAPAVWVGLTVAALTVVFWSTTVILAAPVASTEYVTVIFPASN